MLLHPTRSFRALLWRNALYRKRRWFPSLIEFFLPAFCIFVLYIIKYQLESDENSSLRATVVNDYYPTDKDVIIPFSFHDYVTALQARRVCIANPAPPLIQLLFGLPSLVISGISSRDWPVPFVYCSSYKCQYDGEDATKYCTYRTLGVAPMHSESSAGTYSGHERMIRFKNYTETKYHQLTDRNLLPFDYDLIQVFESNEELQTYVTSDSYGGWIDGVYQPKIAIAIVFDDGENEKSYDYTIRVNSTNYNSAEQEAQPAAKSTPPTDRLFNPYNREDKDSCASSTSGTPNMGKYSRSCTGQYLLNGAITLQRLVDDWILEDAGLTDVTVARNGARFLPFPTKEYVQSGFYQNIAPFAPLLFTLGLLYPIASTIRSIVLEKELRQKELMKMMSVTECDIGWSWFTSFYSFFCLSGVLSAVCTNLLYSSSSFVLLLVFWQLTFIACIVYCFVIAAISSKATRATLIGIMLFFIGYFLPFIVNYQTGNSALITFLSLHPVTAYTYGLIIMGYLEDSGIGVQLTNFASSDFPSGYTFASSLIMLAADCIVWGLLTWYLNRVIPGDYGAPHKWNFLFTRHYWRPRMSFDNDYCNDITDNAENGNSYIIEPISNTMKSNQMRQNNSIRIHKLHKKFGDKIAVDNLELSMYCGQITCLLGHNGAGKTTTIGMLTGMVPPTSGYATVCGYDIRTDMAKLRENVGVCLQHDCLFPQLTVKEHIQFFYRIKGSSLKNSPDDEERSVMSAIEAVDLADKSDTYSKNLSGGMKRKLSVAIAFCGDSKVVFLDEPTSGQDPFSRRFTWNVIRKYRQNRCIVLTTHFMDEADLLGDRIAIMAGGQLKCCGSSLFLKRHFGVGYHLTIIKNGRQFKTFETHHSNAKSEDDQVTNKSQLDDQLIRVIVDSVPSSSMISNAGTEMSFQLPIGESAQFIQMFQKLDNFMLHNTIESYGISVTTMEEVFQIVAREKEEHSPDVNTDVIEESETARSYRIPVNTKEKAFKRHVQALFAKRAKNFKRDRKAWCCSTILPTITSLLGFIIVKYTTSQNPNYSPLTLSLNQNNPDIAKDRNPIPANFPGWYQCQPGRCVYEAVISDSSILLHDTSEQYYYCGSNVKVSNDDNMCSIQSSAEVINQIIQYGAFIVGNEVSDVSDTSMSVYETSSAFKASQYGGIFFTHDNNSTFSSSNESTYNASMAKSCQNMTGNYSTADQCADFSGVGYIVNYNFTSLHSSLLYQALADEALLRKFRNDSNYRISPTIWPLPMTTKEASYNLAQDSFSAWFLLVLSFPFIAGSFATFVVSERESKAKHLQTVAGVKPSAYWLSTYLWDIINYQLPLWTVIGLMYALNVEAFITNEQQVVGATFALLILFGPASSGFSYLLSFFFKSPSFCNLFVIVFNFFVGMAGPIICFILRLLAVDPAQPKPHLKTAAIVTEWILRTVPSFCLGRGLLFCINIGFFEIIEGKQLTAWAPTIALYDVILLGVQSIIYILAAVQIDILSSRPRAVDIFYYITRCSCFKRGIKQKILHENIRECTDEDVDVKAEKDRVSANPDDLIILKDLTKKYPDGKLAVNHLSLGIPSGQCFGLLGVNGAGKTTTMGMLTAEFPPSSGDAFLSGFSVSNEPEQTRRQIGYCPQFDAHFMNMTGEEHIELYAVIKGVPRDFIKEAISAKLSEVGLSRYDSKKLSNTYSGGMKRKLSVACATIGQPQIVFLDEPSCGMDPVARRDLWRVITKMVQGSNDLEESEKTSVILTTHSMEECEALCQRIGIMAGGKLRCLGSAQHLKNRFGKGYQIEMKIRNPFPDDVDVCSNAAAIVSHHLGGINDSSIVDLDHSTTLASTSELYLDLEKVKKACDQLAEDKYLSDMISADDPRGFSIFKLASSKGVGVEDLVLFCAEELRVRSLTEFFKASYPFAVLRERQDVKLRFEIPSDDVTISSVFANIEAHRENFMIEDYSVCQTSLEQVFNFHASEAHKAETKQNPKTYLRLNEDITDEAFIDTDAVVELNLDDKIASNAESINDSSGLTSHANDASATVRRRLIPLATLWSQGARRKKLQRSLSSNEDHCQSADVNDIDCDAISDNKAVVADIESCDESPNLAPLDDSSANDKAVVIKESCDESTPNLAPLDGSSELSSQARKWFPSFNFWKVHRSTSSDQNPTADPMPSDPSYHPDDTEQSNKNEMYNKAIAKQKDCTMQDIDTYQQRAKYLNTEHEATQAELKRLTLHKHEAEDKLLALQDEHVWTSTRLLSTQRELSSTRDVYETRIVLEKQKAQHDIEMLEEEKKHALARENKIKTDKDAAVQYYETTIGELSQTFSNEIEDVKGKKEEVEDKLVALQDEHVWTTAQLLSLQNEIAASTIQYETRMKIEKHKSEHRIELLEADKAEMETRASQLETEIDANIQEYESKIGDLTLSYSNEIDNIKGQKEDAEHKLKTLQDEHVRTSQQLIEAKNTMSSNKVVYENHIKKLENQLQHTTDALQTKIKALENELVYLRANRASTVPARAIPSSTASSSNTEIQNTSDIISLESDAVALGSSIGPNQLHDRPDEIAGQSEFVDIDVFDGSSLSSACSSTSYDA